MIARPLVAVLALVSVAMFGLVAATPLGAPATCCEIMVPGHGVDPQPGQSSYTTVPSAVITTRQFKSLFKIFFIYNNSSMILFFNLL